METFLQEVLEHVVEYAILLFEFVGVAILICAGIRGIIGCIRRNPLTRLDLAKGMAMGLEFKLGSEILRTVVVRELSEILIVGSIILLRAALTFLIHWEIRELENKEIEVPKSRWSLFARKAKNKDAQSAEGDSQQVASTQTEQEDVVVVDIDGDSQ